MALGASFAAMAPVRLPGVHLDWARRMPAPALASGIPVFVGFVAGATEWLALAFDRWDQYLPVFGHAARGHLDYAVRGFFENGGSRCWVVALSLPDAAPAIVMQARLETCFRAAGPMEELAEPDLVCVPDATWGSLGSDASAALAVQRAVLAYCNRMNDRFAIFDCLPASVETHQRHGAAADSIRARGRIPWLSGIDFAEPTTAEGRHLAHGNVSNGAVYWPWIVVAPLPRHRSKGACTVPPCGHVAGVYARIDASVGRHKAPANEVLEGAFDVDDSVDDDTLADLNDDGANSLRVLPGRGVRIWGARSLSSLPAWRYVNVRRVVLGLARWAELGLRDLVMETNQPALWERIRQRVGSHCLARYREGALQGDTPEEAYFVKCDAETNPPESCDQGRVVCEVGLAITTPAEFIVVQLVQSVEGTEFAG